ncbi:MAG: nitroreductase family protein [Paracoccaceae bacterium]|nr:MAG: nitroreductase family protein [Paracoccaceae bacterium]
MPEDPAALAFLSARMSHPAKTLAAPGPDRAAMRAILTAALRVPDHGKLEPWRLVVAGRPTLDAWAAAAADRGAARGLSPEDIDKGRGQFARSAACVAVLSSPVDSPKIPGIEQTLSAGALCLGLVNAAHAAGFGAAWITGWPAYDRGFVEGALGAGPREWVAGFVHMGTITLTPPDRPRPDLARVVTWADDEAGG